LLSAAPAFADVSVTAQIDKTKDITSTINITIDNSVTSLVNFRIVPNKFAQSDAVVNQSNFGNSACENCAEKIDTIGGSSTGAGSIDGNQGYVSVNQAAGNMNNQGNAVAVAIDLGGSIGGPSTSATTPTTGVGFAEADASVQQINGGSNSGSVGSQSIQGDPNTIDTVDIIFRSAVINNSINSNTGVVQVNQSPGQMNNQSNVLSLAFSIQPSGVAMSESDLGQFNQGNFVGESADGANDNVVGNLTVGITKSALISTSVNNNVGIVGVNQSAGNLANQANVVSFAAVVVPH